MSSSPRLRVSVCDKLLSILSIPHHVLCVCSSPQPQGRNPSLTNGVKGRKLKQTRKERQLIKRALSSSDSRGCWVTGAKTPWSVLGAGGEPASEVLHTLSPCGNRAEDLKPTQVTRRWLRRSHSLSHAVSGQSDSPRQRTPPGRDAEACRWRPACRHYTCKA